MESRTRAEARDNARQEAGEHPTGEPEAPQTRGTPPAIEDSGERYIPGGLGSAEVAYDHIARYRFSAPYVEGKRTVDLGAGSGYGAYLLAATANEVVGIDASEEAIAHAEWTYRRPGLSYRVGDVTQLPFGNDEFEAAVSFEVIEHLDDPADLLDETRRVLRDDGVFVVSTPDKRTYSTERNSVNPFHLSEMYTIEFRELLESRFRHVRIYRQGAIAGSLIAADGEQLPADGDAALESTRFSASDHAFTDELPTMLYMIAVCTNGEAPPEHTRPYLLLDRDREIYEGYADLHAKLVKLVTYFAR